LIDGPEIQRDLSTKRRGTLYRLETAAYKLAIDFQPDDSKN
jgi:hypothetical protein